jgi:hypothetical protein
MTEFGMENAEGGIRNAEGGRRKADVGKRILSIFIESKDRAQRFHPSVLDSAESFVPESFKPELTTEGPVAGCGLLFDFA